MDFPGFPFFQASYGECASIGGKSEVHPMGKPGKGSGFKSDDLDIVVFYVIPDVREFA